MNITCIAGDLTDEEREMHYDIARLIVQNHTCPPSVYSLGTDAAKPILMVTDGWNAYVFSDGKRMFRAKVYSYIKDGARAESGTYTTFHYSKEPICVSPNQTFQYVTQLELDFESADSKSFKSALVSSDASLELGAILQFLNLAQKAALDFLGTLTMAQKVTIANSLVNGTSLFIARKGAAVVCQNWQEKFMLLRTLGLGRIKDACIVVSYEKVRTNAQDSIVIITDDPRQPTVSNVSLASPQYIEDFQIPAVSCGGHYERAPRSGSYVLRWNDHTADVYVTTRETAALLREYFAVIAQKPDAIITGTSWRMRSLRDTLSYIYRTTIPSYATLADMEAAVGPAQQFVGLVLSSRKYKGLRVNRTLSELKQKCA